MSVQTVEINGAEVTFLEEGAGDPVVLLSGLLGDYRVWRRQIDALRSKYRVIAVSQRYYWPNRWPDDGTGFGVGSHVADLAALLRQLRLPPVHLVGHSYGGGVVGAFAVEHPSLVRTLVLAEPALVSVAADAPEMPRLMAEFGENRKIVFDEWQKGHQAKAVEEQLLFVFGIETLNRIRDEHFDMLLENGAIIGAALRVRPPPAPFTPEKVQRLTMPVLLIEGEVTKLIFRVTCEKLANLLPNVERTIIPGASHALYMEAPRPFSEAVLRFLAAH
jgi:non-heme chloroperoxidase